MHWVHLEYLWLLLVLLPLSAWAAYGQWQRRRTWRALGQRGRAPRDGSVRFLLGALCLVVALAQPRFGRAHGPALPPGHDVVLVVDVSRSMAVEDAVPNRLAVAVEAAKSLVNALADEPANRAGVVAFAGRGVLRCPLTENLGAVLDALDRLRPGAVEPGGTDLGAGLDAALEAVGPEEHAQGRSVVIFSDGEDHDDTWNTRLNRLKDAGVVVHAVAIGDSDQGHPVPAEKAAEPLRYHGQPVLSRRLDTTLEAITRGAGGALVKLGLTSADLGSLYQTRIEPAARIRHDASPLAERAERFPLFLAGALALVLGACWPPGRRWRFIAGAGWYRPWSWPSSWRWARRRGRGRRLRPSPAATTGLVLALALGAALGANDASPGTGAREAAPLLIARGQAEYALQHYEEALAAFEAAVAREPRQPVPRYNAAAALFQLGRYAESQKRYQEARERAGNWLRTKIDFVLGNTALALGDIPGAVLAYDRCLASTATGSALDDVRRDAAINRKFALEKAQSLAVPPSSGAGDESNPRRRDPNRRGAGDEPSADGPSPGEAGGGSAPDGGSDDGQNRPPVRRRRVGGAGGSRPARQGASGNSPEDQLEAALEQIRAAQTRKLPEEPTHESKSGDRKDW